MYILTTTRQFEKDYKRCKQRGNKVELLNSIFAQLEQKGTLPLQYAPHKLKGNYNGFWECHIQPDWLLIWFKDDSTKTISLTRTGTHSDLF